MINLKNLNDKNKKIIVSIIVLVLGIAALIGYKSIRLNNNVEGTKEYTLIVRDTNNSFNEEFDFKTDETYLGKDLDNRNIIKTDDSGASRFVTGVNNIDADSSKQEWWNLKINGEDSMTGVDDTTINDGDKIEFILTTGW